MLKRVGALVLIVVLAAVPRLALAHLDESDVDYQNLKAALMPDPGPRGGGRTTPMAIPDIFGPGAVLNVGNVYMKVTNNGFNGNPFTATSSDPSGQWPGASSIEYLNFLALAVGAVNPFASDPNAVRRVSYAQEWRPATLDPEDKIYRGYDGIVNGVRFGNDDGDSDPLTGDPRIDEDFLDGRDNDGDGRIDEDFAAIGQQMFSCVMRDDTPQAINATSNEKHVPLGVECRQLAWAYSIPGFQDFNVVEYTIINRSGHQLDSVIVGFRVDMDCGPFDKPSYWTDDFDIPMLPQGDFTIITPLTDLRLQPKGARSRIPGIPEDSALCPRYNVRVNGFSFADDDGDDNKTTGIPTFMLLDHTIDPLGRNGPSRVGFRSFRSFVGGTPYNQGGNPTIDQQRFELLTSTEKINQETGFIDAPPGDQKGDYQAYCSVGPYLHLADRGQVQVTVAVGVREGVYRIASQYPSDLARYNGGSLGAEVLLAKYKQLENALTAQVAFEGTYEVRPWPIMTNGHGRETPLKMPPGELGAEGDCRDNGVLRQINDRDWEWFDFDCNYCTGAWSPNGGPNGTGYFHHTWLAESPPPSPALNSKVDYNFTDNPNRVVTPAGDNTITLAWDNLSEVTPDPKTGAFDFRGYRIWKVAGWTRPVGSGGPRDDDWSLMGEFRYFNYASSNQYWKRISATESTLVCPRLYIPQRGDSMDVCLNYGDLFDKQSGIIIRPDTTIGCVKVPIVDTCQVEYGLALGTPTRVGRTKYQVGRYRLVDHEVKNGFIYFYSVSAFDSTGAGASRVELSGRRAGVEAEGVVPQISTSNDKGVWVVPNPYRGVKSIQDRPSTWDLTPNASDPTGTHLDFLGLPSGEWTIKIFTVSGDLVEVLKSSDAVNESVRGTVSDGQGGTLPGFNRQQDNANDGQARWNLISRNGQDVVSGIYIFTVESKLGTQRGKFIVIR